MRHHRHILVEHLMTTAVIPVRATDSLDLAREQMAVAGIRHLPVIDHAQQVIGILSSRDLLRATRKHNHGRVADYMTIDVVTVAPSLPAAEAALRMRELKIGSLPVVGDDQKLIGILTETDFLAVAERALRGLDLLESRSDQTGP